MNNQNTTYKRLGDYIREVDVRNRDLSVSILLGLSMTKEFRPSTSNVVGTDLSKYKVVQEGQFAFDTMSVIRVHKVPICYNNLGYPIIISPAYITFEVIDESALNPQYLKLVINRSEFDRYADFKSDSAVRGGYNWEELCDTLIPIPDPTEQQRIVDRYNAIQHRIETNKQTIAKLEEAAQALYKKMFVDDIDVENLPEGWRMGKYTDIVKISGGGTPNTKNKLFWTTDIPFFSPSDVSYGYYSISTEKHISKMGLENCSSKLYPKESIFITVRGTVGEIAMAGIPMAMNQSNYAIDSSLNKNIHYLHQLTMQVVSKLKNEAVGAVFSALVTKDFENFDIVIPKQLEIDFFESKVVNIYESTLLSQKENETLTKMLSLLMVEMG